MIPGVERGIDPSQIKVIRLVAQRVSTIPQTPLTEAALGSPARDAIETAQTQKGKVFPFREKCTFTLIRGDTLMLRMSPHEFVGETAYTR